MGPRRSRALVGLRRGERVLATASGLDGDIVATTLRLMPPGELADIEWNMVDRASWDGDSNVLDVVGVPDPSGRRRRLQLPIESPGRLVDVVREQVVASIVINRWVPIEGARGVEVIGRRAQHGELVWSAIVDDGIDPDDSTTRARIDAAVVLVRREVE